MSVAASAIAIAGSALAHDFWIQPSRFWVAPGGTASLAILVGHGSARQHWVLRLNRVVALYTLGPDGRQVDQSSKLQQGTYAPDATIGFTPPGVHLVAFENSASLNNLPAARFNDYLAAEGIRPALEWRQQTHTTDQPGRELYSRRAKALVQVGPPTRRPQPQVTRPLGMTLEIVPEVDPYNPGAARAIPIRVFYRGHPQPGAFVKLTNLDADERPVETHLTDQSGRALFSLRRSGEWQFNVVWTRPIRGNPDADFESTFSSLTFGFAGGAH